MKKGKIIRIVALIAALVAAISSIFIIRGCNAPPDYAEIKDRFEQLVNDSHAVNVIAFGEGLPTYERVSDPVVKVSATDEFYINEDGEKVEIKLSYYRVADDSGNIYAFRYSNFDKYAYAVLCDGEQSAESLKARFPAIAGVSVPRGLIKMKMLDKGSDTEREVWYYRTFDKENTVYAFRNGEKGDFSYVFVADGEQSTDDLKALFPAIEGVSAPAGKEFYTQAYASADGKQFSYYIPYVETQYELYGKLYASADGKKVAYLVPYEEIKPEFVYSSDIPDDYDVARDDCAYHTVDELKALIQSVYSRNYSISLFSSLFDGLASADQVEKARYIPIMANGKDALAQLNTSEPLFTEKRVYMFETAKILKSGSSSNNVCVSVQTYLPSNPNKIFEAKINLVLQDGQWFLDSPTF